MPAELPPHSAGPEPIRLKNVLIHGTLFALTFASVTLGYALFTTPLPGVETASEAILTILTTPEHILAGLPFSASLLAILMAHEMGHYLTARHLEVAQSLPYFIPAPGTFFGTFGAIIIMRRMPKTRSSLLRVAVMGPYAGLLVAIPCTAWGLAHSTLIAPEIVAGPGPHMNFGSSILFHWLEAIFSPHGTDAVVQPHPVGLAGWVGLLITALNLIPAGQLDGGHTIYALLGDYHRPISRAVAIILLAMGLYTFDEGGLIWVMWAGLLTLFGLKHPPVLRPHEPLNRSEKWAGGLAIFLFILTFVPQPIRIEGLPETSESVQTPAALEKQHPAEEFDL